jgi:hypothetical protein
MKAMQLVFCSTQTAVKGNLAPDFTNLDVVKDLEHKLVKKC